AGRVEHGGEIGLAVAIGVGEGGLGEAAGNLVGDNGVLAGHGHGEHIGDVEDVLILDELLGQAGFTTGGQMDDVGIVAALHGGADDVFQVAVDNQVNVDASGLGEGVGDLRPDIGAVSG